MWIIVGIFLLIGLDQLTKFWALTLQELPGMTYPLWKDVFHLTYTENSGAAFSILEGQIWFFVVITVLMLSGVVLYCVKVKKRSPWINVALMLIVSGAIGNFVDRIRQQYVVDFFEFRFVDFAVFNVADMCLTFGALALLIYLFVIEPLEIRRRHAEARAQNAAAVETGISGEAGTAPHEAKQGGAQEANGRPRDTNDVSPRHEGEKEEGRDG